ncbi:MAG: 5-formyltetrahydrofolate cyclo-ligase [Oscillospiraceae bacterium]|jgi:5-formyltetrahydrofolate cyclo-ligase|nr:5-formyltetrahydrofolate cyclo-ligase [Oscillospiraceae bacterium]
MDRSKTAEEKRRLRRELRGRDSDPKSRADADVRIFERLFSLEEIAAAENILCYISVGDEPDTSRIIKELFLRGKRVFAPVCTGRTEMAAVEISEHTVYTPNGFGIPEPEGAAAEKSAIDTVIVPGMAFDRRGNRLGHGAGYYDRYLSGTKARKLGLCYDINLLESLPCGETDVVMDAVLTQSETVCPVK